MPTRLLLADDHDVVRAGLRTILKSIGGMEVVAEAQTGRQAVELSREHEPDVVLIDISMPDLNGLDAARQILALDPHPKVLAVSMHADARFVNGALKAGAHGYVLKNRAGSELPLALVAVSEGRMYLSPAVTSIVVERYLRHEPSTSSSLLDSLSNREREVLQLLAEGKTSKEIAGILHVSVKTVEAQRGNIMNKLQIHTVAELTKFAIREGLTFLE